MSYNESERTSTGVEGLDEVIEGGIPKGSVAMLTGGPGTGKTTFASHFIFEGLEKGENCIYISTEERPDDIKKDAAQFGIEFDKYTGHFRIPYIVPSDDIMDEITQMISEGDHDRIVLDSISVLAMFWGEDRNIRMLIKDLINQLRKSGATILITAELPSEEGKLSRHGVTEYVVDGVIKMYGFALGQSSFRSAQVVKMRRTNIDGNVLNVAIDEQGMHIEEDEGF
jgi:KaiC/GvpD/RAD55 family RecA-like ATPase